MKKYLQSVVIAGISIFLVCCGQPECKNENGVFARYAPDSKEYKDELARQFAGNNTLRFFIDSLQEKDGITYLAVSIYGDRLCAKAIMAITKNDGKLDGVISKKGMSYRGAELVNLQMEFQQDSSGKSTLVYKNVEAIID